MKQKKSQIETRPLLTRNVRMDRSSLIYIYNSETFLVLLLCCALEIKHIPKSSLTFIALMSLVSWLSASFFFALKLLSSVDEEIAMMSLPRSYEC